MTAFNKKTSLLCAAGVLALGNTAAAGPIDLGDLAQSRSAWPTRGFPHAAKQAPVDSQVCQDTLAFGGFDADSSVLAELKTDGLLVVRGGEIIFARYSGLFDADRPHPLWSASKSVTQGLVGAAIQAGVRLPSGVALTLDSTVASVYPRRPDGFDDEHGDHYDSLTVGDLLDMGSGIAWSESYEDGVVGSNVLEMLYIEGFGNMVSYVLSQPFVDVGPGNIYNYSSGNLSVVLGMMKEAYEAAGDDYDRMPWELLFDPIGIDTATFEQDGSGVFVGSSYVHMTPEDMAKFGYLYLNDGCWGLPTAEVGPGKRYQACGSMEGPGWRLGRVLPEGFVSLTREANQAYLSDNTEVDDIVDDGVYGMTWWLNLLAKGFDEPSYPRLPLDAFAALGHYGQLIIVIPSLDVVIARTGNDLEYNSKINRFVGGLLECLDLEEQR